MLCVWNHIGYWEQTIILTEEQAIGTFWDRVQFFFFSDHCTLKFLRMKCNPRNKNLWPNTEVNLAVILYFMKDQNWLGSKQRNGNVTPNSQV